MNNRIIVFVLVVGLLIPISSWGQHRQFEIGKGIQKSDYTMAFIPGKVQAQYDYRFEEVVFKVGCYGSLAATAVCAGVWAINDYKYNHNNRGRAEYAEKANSYRTATAISAGVFGLFYLANYIDAIAVANRARIMMAPVAYTTGEVGISLAFTF